MIDRRTFIGTLAGGLLASPFITFAQQPTKLPRIGVLGNEDSPPWEGFRQGLRELGYVDGRNVTMEWRWSEGRTDRLPALALELVQLKVDIIVASGTQAIRAAKEATSTIPIVMAVSAYPDKIGLVESLARPGGNVTGLSNVAPELMGKRFQLLKEIAPKVSRVAVLWNPASPVEPLGFRDMLAAAAASWPGDPVDRGAHARRLRRGLRDRDWEPCRCLVCLRQSGQLQEPAAHCGLCLEEPAPEHLRGEALRRVRRSFVVRAKFHRPVPTRCDLRRQDPQGREAGRPSGRAADEVRAGDQSRRPPRRSGLTIPQSLLLRADEVIQ